MSCDDDDHSAAGLSILSRRTCREKFPGGGPGCSAVMVIATFCKTDRRGPTTASTKAEQQCQERRVLGCRRGFAIWGCTHQLHVWSGRISGWRESRSYGPQFRISPTLEQLSLQALFISNRHKSSRALGPEGGYASAFAIASRHMISHEPFVIFVCSPSHGSRLFQLPLPSIMDGRSGCPSIDSTPNIR